MTILESDIKLLASQRMTDTPDGGGRMTGVVVQSGVDNNILDDISNLDRVYGNVSLRKVFAGVMTDNTDKYMGARVVIDQPPSDPNVQCLIFGASSTFDTRSEVSVKVESYLSRGVSAMYYLYGDHIIGQASIQLASAESRDTPPIGTVFILEGGGNDQYVRITTASSIVAEFPKDDGKSFKIRLSTLGLSDPLRYDFQGWGAREGGMVTKDQISSAAGTLNRALVFESVVADASQYFGIRPLSAAANLGDFSIKADTIYSSLLPSAQIETPLSSLSPHTAKQLPVPAYGPVTYTAAHTWSVTTALSLPGGCLPGTLSIVVGGITITDSAGKLMSGGVQIGGIDYVNGVLSLSTGALSGSKVVTYTPAAYVLRTPQSTEIPVTIESRSQSYVGTVYPIPQPGTLTVAYMAGGMWYTLSDSGDGALRGTVAGHGAGTFNPQTGAYIATLGALPDVGSSLILTWGVPTQETTHPTATLKASQSVRMLSAPGEAIQPGTLSLSWPLGGATQTATAGVDGTLTGAATGKLSSAMGTLQFAPNVLPAVGTVCTLSCIVGPKMSDTFSHPSRDTNGTVPVTATLGAIIPGSLEVEWNTFTELAVLGTYTTEQVVEMGIMGIRVDPIQVARDDGAGNLKLNGATVGTVDYATGHIVFQPDVVIKIPRPVYSPAVTSGPKWRLNYSSITYVDAPSLYPNDESGSVTIRYNSSGAGNNFSSPFVFTPSFRLLTDVQSAVVPGSVYLTTPGNQPWGDSGVGTLREFTTSGWLTRGTIDYLTGTVTLSSWEAGSTNAISRVGCTTTVGESLSSEYVFRTSNAPLRPGLLSISFARATGGVQTLTASTTGVISGPGVSGSVDYEYGVVRVRFGEMVSAAGKESEPWFSAGAVTAGEIFKPAPVAVSTLRYNAVAYSYLPLDASILGLDPVRLPSDGRVPVFKAGRVVLVHNTQSIAPQTVSDAQLLDTGRTRLSRVRVLGADGLPITQGWTANKEAGTVLFTNVSGYAQPVVVEHRIEDEALCAEAQITGDMRLTRPLTHSYPVEGTYVSSAMIAGTKQAAATESFSQTSWLSTWESTASGAPLLAQYNQTLHPITVTNRGAIEESWALIFTGTTTFRVVGKASGEIYTCTTGETCAPINPATGVPYFTLSPGGWGAGWAAGNVLRFDTRAANWPIWVSRTVLQSPAAPPGSDRIVLSIRGDIDV